MRRFSSLSLLCFATLLTIHGFAQSTNPPAPAPTLVPIVAPLFIENGELSTILTVVSQVKSPHPATVVLTDASGAEIARQELLVQGHTNQVVQIHDLLSKSGSNATFGSVLLATPDGDAMPLAAQLSVTWAATGRAFFEQEFSLAGGNSQTFRATAVDVKNSPLIAIKSLSGITQSITVACIPENGSASTTKLQLAAGELRLLPVCSPQSDAQTFLSAEVRKSADENATDGVWLGSVGVAVTTDAQPQDLLVSGFSIYRDERGPYFSSLSFSNETGQSPSATVFAGIPMGKEKLLRDTAFRPLLGVTNFSENPALVKVTVANTISGKPTTDTKSVRLAPNTTTTLRLPPNDALGITTSLVVDSDQPAGNVTVSFAAKGDAILPLVELQPKNSTLRRKFGGHPWSIESGRSSTLLIFNHSSQTEKFNVGIGSGSHTWQQTYALASMETKAISVNDIVSRQQPDMKDRKLPVDARSGHIAWTVTGSGAATGRLLQSDPGVGLVRSFSTGGCSRLCPRGALTPDASSLIDAGDSGDLGGIVVDDCLYPCVNVLGCGLANEDTGYQDFPNVFSWLLPSFLSLTSVDSGTGTARFLGIGSGSDLGSWHAKISDDPNLCTVAGTAPTTALPIITGISPAQGAVGVAASVTITGKGFALGATVSAGTNVAVSNVAVKSSTQITAIFTPTNSSTAGGNQAVSVKVGTLTSDPKKPKYFYVQVPTYFYATGMDQTTNYCSTMEAPFPGMAGSVHYQVLDPNGKQIVAAGLTPFEQLYQDGHLIATYGIFSTPVTTGSDGLFDDKPVGACFPSPPPPGKGECNDPVTQNFEVKINGVTYLITTVATQNECYYFVTDSGTGNLTGQNYSYTLGAP